MGIIVQDDSFIHVDIIGDAGTPEQKEYVSNIKAMIKEKNLENFFSFIGPTPNKDLPQYLQKSDMFVNMSHTGSLDKAILEAMASGVIVVTCNEALSNVLGEYADMLMFPKKDFKEFAKKIKFVKNIEEQERSKLAIKLRDVVVEKNNLEKLVGNILRY